MSTMIITGATSGLGEAFVLRFAREGRSICAIARNETKLATLVDKYPGIIEAYPTDIADAKQVKRTFAAIHEKHAVIQVLINNAGVLNRTRFGEADWEIIDKVIDTNLKGTMYCTYAALPSMIARKEGTIINIASTAGIPGSRLVAGPGRGTISLGDYGASKFGVVGFGDTLARDLLYYGIHLITLCPGGMDTPMARGREDASELTKPEEVAELVAFLLKQPKNTLYKQVVLFPTNEWH